MFDVLPNVGWVALTNMSFLMNFLRVSWLFCSPFCSRPTVNSLNPLLILVMLQESSPSVSKPHVSHWSLSCAWLGLAIMPSQYCTESKRRRRFVFPIQKSYRNRVFECTECKKIACGATIPPKSKIFFKKNMILYIVGCIYGSQISWEGSARGCRTGYYIRAPLPPQRC